jgi:hypothetical protein
MPIEYLGVKPKFVILNLCGRRGVRLESLDELFNLELILRFERTQLTGIKRALKILESTQLRSVARLAIFQGIRVIQSAGLR